jgi:Icc-related predicted phosphoesterase
MTKIVAVSDLHGRHKKVTIPECDMLLVAGDLTPKGEIPMFGSFCRWLEDQPAEHKVVIAGNHDWCLFREHVKDACERQLQDTGAVYLQYDLAEVAGYKVFGMPWTPEFCGWAFMLGPSALKHKWASVPACDILISHGPPRGICDQVGGVFQGQRRVERVGDVYHRQWLDTHVPKLNVFGHIHDAHGQETTPNGTLCANVSILDDAYEVTYEPTCIDLEPE